MKNKTLFSIILLIISICPFIKTSALSGTQTEFSDVSTDDPYFEAIEYLEEKGIISGYPDGTFQANNLINRAEFTKIVIGATRSYKQYAFLTGNCFPDVLEEWFAPYVCAAKRENIIEGYGTGFFEPNQNIIFAEAAKIIVNSFGYEVVAGDPWYEPYQEILSQENATPNSILAPNQEITRGEMAEIIYSLHYKTAQETSDCNLYTYQDPYNANVGEHCLNHVTLKGIYFVAKNQTDEVIIDWNENMIDIFGKMKTFYEAEFDNKIEITIEEPEIRYGEKNVEEYTSMYEEVFKEELAGQTTADHYTIYQVYYYSPTGSYGGGTFLEGDSVQSNGSISFNPSFWLEDDGLCTITNKYGTNCYGYVLSGHEFGHTLGLSHPWEMEINRDLQGNLIDPIFKYSEKGNIMSYAGSILLSGDPTDPFGGYFVMEEAKEVMIME
ncbi:MAG: S-layer homology domain-containing protein [Candidatus Gracilibacteria bacterium]